MRNAFRVRIHGDQCVYCGERANSDEHFPPASYGNLGFLLPACRECNSFAGTAHPVNFLKRLAYVKEQIKSHAPRFTFTSEVTLQDILARPENVWLAEMRFEKRKAIYRNRFNWDAMAYIATIQTRRYKFVVDFSQEIEENFEEIDGPDPSAVLPQEDETSGDLASQAARQAMAEAHREELLQSLLENLPKFSTKHKEELLLDDDLEFLASETYFGRHLTQKQFEILLVCARRVANFIAPDEIRHFGDAELIEFIKDVR
ncbi:hypothetical protein HFO91_30440 [Rhizobium leguminosarum]|uniref:hypothetical protein n=1 Tax=Rhizobium leguminosarum TaxID=384 RepID=UPI001C980AB9|nr:hypothetical protein [Rhizobium leguminosarum]MBY5453899.1 hypothetical protein [Rhizobium leguminosarum]